MHNFQIIKLFSALIIAGSLYSCGGAVTSDTPAATSSSFSSTTTALSSSVISSASSASISASSATSASITNSSAPSSSVANTAIDKIAPTTPTNLRKTALSSSSLTLAWNASTDNLTVTGYKVYRDSALIAILSGSTLSYTDKNLQVDHAYTYTVSAGDAAGNWSSEASLAVQVFHSTTLTWNPPNQRENGVPLSTTEIGGYSVKYTSQTDKSVALRNFSGGSTVSATVDGLVGAYNFEIATYDLDGIYSSYATVGIK